MGAARTEGPSSRYGPSSAAQPKLQIAPTSRSKPAALDERSSAKPSSADTGYRCRPVSLIFNDEADASAASEADASAAKPEGLQAQRPPGGSKERRA